jgi:hypothetical protein
MIAWREKFIATGVHFGVTLLLAAIAAALIFLVWYPRPFDTMIGGTELFVLIVGSDLVLGPLMSLVLYNSRKTRRALLFDYTLVGVLQLAALAYGISIMADARPVYVAYSKDRYEIVLAGDLKEKELAAARDPRFARVPWTGPEYVAVVISSKDYQDALFEALAGNEEHQRPKFYVPYASQLGAVRKHAKPLAVLEEKKPQAKSLIQAALRGEPKPQGEYKWLPVRHFRGFWTAIVDDANGEVVAWVDLDPYD